MPLGPKRPKPEPLWEDVGSFMLMEIEKGEWQIVVEADGQDYDLPAVYATEGAALDAAKAWAAQRGLSSTWTSNLLRRLKARS